MQGNIESSHQAARPNMAGWALVFVVLCLTALGLVVLSSVGRGTGNAYFYLMRQTIWLLPALTAFALAASIKLEFLRRLTPWLGLGVLLLLVGVLIPGIGVEVNGARRWLDLGPMRMQPSDLAKIAMVLVLADFMARHHRRIGSFRVGFFVPVAMVGLVSGLIILEPDFGTAALCGAVGFCLMFLAGVRLFYLIPTVLAGAAGFATMVYHDPVRMERIMAFLYPEENRADSAYQLWQGILAFGAGGVDGVGLGNGRQQLSFLPEAHTDFIFPILGEELGLFATLGVCGAFLGLFAICIFRLRWVSDLYQFLLIFGALLFITLQAVINMGVVTGLLPTKGMSLPFISYGGTNLVVMFTFIGLIFNCFRRSARPPLQATEL